MQRNRKIFGAFFLWSLHLKETIRGDDSLIERMSIEWRVIDEGELSGRRAHAKCQLFSVRGSPFSLAS